MKTMKKMWNIGIIKEQSKYHKQKHGTLKYKNDDDYT